MMVQKDRIPKAGSNTKNEIILSTLLDVQKTQGLMWKDIGLIKGETNGFRHDVDDLQDRMREIEGWHDQHPTAPPPTDPTPPQNPEQTWWEHLTTFKKILIITTSLLVLGSTAITTVLAV